jgi:putative oxidoreductase
MISLATKLPAGAMPVVALYERAVGLVGRFPEALTLLMLRVGVAMVFWKSGLTKLRSWDSTIFLFAEEYRVPLLSPEAAAYLGTAAEIGGSVALILGLGSRFAALALLGVTAVIQLFVYPQLWHEHIFWLAALLVILTRGPGTLSLDALVKRHLGSARG